MPGGGGVAQGVEPMPVVVVVVCPFLLAPVVVAVLGVDAVVGIGDVGEGIETCVGSRLSPLESEPQPATARSSDAASIAGRTRLRTGNLMAADSHPFRSSEAPRGSGARRSARRLIAVRLTRFM